MANTKNLRPPKTKEEARRRGRNGGMKSAETRKKKRTMKDAAETMLNLSIAQDHVRDNVRMLGVDDEDSTNMMAIMARMTLEAMSGNVKAADFLRDVVGSDSVGQDRAERLKLEKERRKLEIQKMKMESIANDGDGLPTIINVRPNDNNVRPDHDNVRPDNNNVRPDMKPYKRDEDEA